MPLDDNIQKQLEIHAASIEVKFDGQIYYQEFHKQDGDFWGTKNTNQEKQQLMVSWLKEIIISLQTNLEK